jgi:hypothetical protein
MNDGLVEDVDDRLGQIFETFHELSLETHNLPATRDDLFHLLVESMNFSHHHWGENLFI